MGSDPWSGSAANAEWLVAVCAVVRRIHRLTLKERVQMGLVRVRIRKAAGNVAECVPLGLRSWWDAQQTSALLGRG